MNIAKKCFELGKKCYPTRATWEITSRCNARCDYCYLHDERDIPEHCDTAEAFHIVDKLYTSGVLFLVLTGGEPFIRKDIISILEYITSKDFYSVTIFSNGTLINDEHIKFLISHKDHIKSMQFSVFSHIPEINDAYLGVEGALEKILFVGKNLKDAGIPVVLAFNLFDFNVKECEVTKRLFAEKGFPVRMSFSKILMDSNHEQCVKKDVSKNFFTTYLKSIDQSLVKKTQLRLSKKEKPTTTSNDFCSGLFTSIAIDHRGNILPCISFRKLALGSIFSQQSIRDMLLSSQALHQLRSLNKGDLKACVDCKFLNECVFCLGMMHTRNNDATKPMPHYCAYLKALETYKCRD